MKKFVVIGSCLSGSIAKELIAMGFKLLKAVNHLRADAITAYLSDNESFGAPMEWITDFLHERELDESVGGRRFKRRILEQSWENLSELQKAIKHADFLIFDTNYDLASNNLSLYEENRSYRFCNLNKHLDLFSVDGLLNFEPNHNCYSEFISILTYINPSLQTIIIQYPTSGFELNPRKSERVARANELAQLLIPLSGKSLPLVKIPSNCLCDKGAHYFSDHTYVTFARAIARAITKGEDFPFDPSVQIEMSELEAYASVVENASTPDESHSEHPYQHLPDRQFWKSAVGTKYPLEIRDLYNKKFPITSSDGIATCGSCFAQHIGYRLKNTGFRFLDYEQAPSTIPKDKRIANGYGIYSARYGNVYTTTQLKQLLERAFGLRNSDEVWEVFDSKGSSQGFVDPFRPNLFPIPLKTPAAVLSEQSGHLNKVRRMFEELDVFIFTMGLTEHWYNKITDSVYPIAPGVTASQYDDAIHGFRNLTYEQTKDDMLAAIELIRKVNSNFRILLTVSPVPLTATAENRHVLVSTTYSKSVLRAVAGDLASEYSFIDYFPSYEIVVTPPFRGMFFQSNMRSIHDAGVDYVMSHFFSAHPPVKAEEHIAPSNTSSSDDDELCDEVFLELNRMART